MHSGKAFRSRNFFSQGVEGKGRGIGGEDRIGRVEGGKLCEEVKLDLRSFDDGFDEEVCPTIRDVGGLGKTFQDGIALRGGELVLFHQDPEVLFNRVSPFLHHLFVDVV
jgi:hypothetical protein